MVMEGFDCSDEESSDVEGSSDDSLVLEELIFMEGEVESRERVLVWEMVSFYKAMVAIQMDVLIGRYTGIIDYYLHICSPICERIKYLSHVFGNIKQITLLRFHFE